MVSKTTSITGKAVRLSGNHRDKRPTTARGWHTPGESVVLSEAREGYYTWNIFDIEFMEWLDGSEG